MVRQTYHGIAQKVAMLDIMAERLQNGESRRSIARDLNVDASQIRRWEKQRPLMEEKLKKTNANPRAATLHSGGKSQLEPIGEDLLKYIWEKRDIGLPVSVRMVKLKARQLCAEFRRKSERSQDQSVRLFIAAHGITVTKSSP